jgi:ATP-dependent Clp protease protease subunit
MSSLVPMVIKKNIDGSERGMDIYSRLLDDRIIFCTGMIEPEMASSIVAQLLYLEAEDPNKPISLYISGPGGDVSAGFSIISTMNLIKCPVSTIIHGTVASMSTVIAASGEKGMRYCLPNSEIMIHTASSGSRGKVQDMEIDFLQLQKINDKVLNHLAKCTNTSIIKIKKDCDRDFWLDENEWKKYGGCDKIIIKK